MIVFRKKNKYVIPINIIFIKDTAGPIIIDKGKNVNRTKNIIL